MVGTSRCDVPARVPSGGTADQACPARKSVPSPNATLGDGDGAARPSLPACQSTGESKNQKQRIDGSLVRNGKIARLPAVLREALNRALARGVNGPDLLDWLNDLPEIQALLRREFKGQPISPQNLSQWRQGGFRDWLRKQEAREVLCEFAASHQKLSALELNEKVALWLGARMVCMTEQLEQLDPLESWPMTRQMVRDVASLRRGDHRIREQKFKEQAKHKITRQEHMDWVMEPGRLDWLVRQAAEREGRSDEEIREVRYALFGMLAGDDPEDLAWEARKRGVPIEHLDEARDAESREYWAKKAAEEAGELAQPEEEEEQTDQNPPPEEKNKYKQARVRKGKGPTTTTRTRTRTIKGTTDQGNSNEIKPNQSESKRNLPPAAETPPLSAESPNSKNQTPTNTCATPQPESAVQVGLVGRCEGACTSAAAPAPEKPLTGPGITFPKRPAEFVAQCICGAKNQIPLSGCRVCARRIQLGREACPCH
jgi:hypothetical protein